MNEQKMEILLEDTLLGNVVIFTDGMQSFPYPWGKESSLMEIDRYIWKIIQK